MLQADELVSHHGPCVGYISFSFPHEEGSVRDVHDSTGCVADATSAQLLFTTHVTASKRSRWPIDRDRAFIWACARR